MRLIILDFVVYFLNHHEFQTYSISSETRRGFHVLQLCTLLGIEVTVAKGALSGLVTTSGDPTPPTGGKKLGLKLVL
jgi:hypothetical protein